MSAAAVHELDVAAPAAGPSQGAVSAPAEPPHSASANGLVCVGVSHRTAPVALRERLAIAESAVSTLLSRFGCGENARPSSVSELVILSTCNRLEAYATGGRNAASAVLTLLEETTGVPAAELEPVVYTLTGADAVRHLARTAAGLESMVIGEPQILGQVSEAFAAAAATGAAGHVMSTLFRGAIRAGRRARSETAINRNPITVSSVAVRLAEAAIPDLRQASVVVVGAGEMAELAVSALHYRGVNDISVVSRTREHADRLAEHVGGRPVSLERLQDALCGADVVISSTSAPHHVITRSMVSSAMACRPDRPMLLIDIAMPRDVDPAAATVPGVTYADLDAIQQHVQAGIEERASEIPAVETVVEHETAECLAALQQLEVQPLIADLRAHTDDVRRVTLDGARRHFAHLSERDRAHIEAFSESLVNRLFHQPTQRLRQEARNGQVAGYAMAVRHLFGLKS
ncbi:MAG: glutamyl-tRNA reductase [Gemmatimonadota bacterium]|nr:glutamyl-tRNA reductase [Gemmatimonadota bacterium]MDE3127466.1 glutamyl-tRNA reductase [Gemmatimonadota bacterium]MDE3171680.1 glutamyl-tRNA reductase [Gemmatimonadota bacterium]MDE3215875.1 glutamyl-tRNA reductase [Gemmatimonadota bacterium]